MRASRCSSPVHAPMPGSAVERGDGRRRRRSGSSRIAADAIAAASADQRRARGRASARARTSSSGASAAIRVAVGKSRVSGIAVRRAAARRRTPARCGRAPFAPHAPRSAGRRPRDAASSKPSNVPGTRKPGCAARQRSQRRGDDHRIAREIERVLDARQHRRNRRVRATATPSTRSAGFCGARRTSTRPDAVVPRCAIAHGCAHTPSRVTVSDAVDRAARARNASIASQS